MTKALTVCDLGLIPYCHYDYMKLPLEHNKTLLGVFCVDDLEDGGYGLEWDDDGKGAVVSGLRFLGKEVSFHVFTRKRWAEILEEGGLVVVREELVTFVPPEEVKGDPGPDYFVLARKPEAPGQE